MNIKKPLNEFTIEELTDALKDLSEVISATTRMIKKMEKLGDEELVIMDNIHQFDTGSILNPYRSSLKLGKELIPEWKEQKQQLIDEIRKRKSI